MSLLGGAAARTDWAAALISRASRPAGRGNITAKIFPWRGKDDAQTTRVTVVDAGRPRIRPGDPQDRGPIQAAPNVPYSASVMSKSFFMNTRSINTARSTPSSVSSIPMSVSSQSPMIPRRTPSPRCPALDFRAVDMGVASPLTASVLRSGGCPGGRRGRCRATSPGRPSYAVVPSPGEVAGGRDLPAAGHRFGLPGGLALRPGGPHPIAEDLALREAKGVAPPPVLHDPTRPTPPNPQGHSRRSEHSTHLRGQRREAAKRAAILAALFISPGCVWAPIGLTL
jgi:hypothetical protein